MNILLDTNILSRSSQPHHALYKIAVDATAMLRTANHALCLLPQNLYEYWVVCTRPLGENGLGLTVAEAVLEIAKLKGLFRILDDTPAILPAWEKLVVKYQVSGKNGHDARLVAGMIVHGIDRILTFNKIDFQRYQEIAVLSPDEVIQGSTVPSP